MRDLVIAAALLAGVLGGGCGWDDADDYEAHFGVDSELLSWCDVAPGGLLDIEVQQIRSGVQRTLIRGQYDPATADSVYRSMSAHLRRPDVAGNFEGEMSVDVLCGQRPPVWLRYNSDGTFTTSP